MMNGESMPTSGKRSGLSKRELEIDGAVRRGLVAWEDTVRGTGRGYPLDNWRWSGISDQVRQAVADLIALPEPTLDEVVASMREHGGIMRVSEFGELPDGRLVEPEMLDAAREIVKPEGSDGA